MVVVVFVVVVVVVAAAVVVEQLQQEPTCILQVLNPLQTFFKSEKDLTSLKAKRLADAIVLRRTKAALTCPFGDLL